ncbi:Uncharacterised protein [Mycobacteroides abscessus subsp. abscessus]|nr:Uncharacterised protein [Mycobacteroides abscessus subsp. abscessus]
MLWSKQRQSPPVTLSKRAIACRYSSIPIPRSAYRHTGGSFGNSGRSGQSGKRSASSFIDKVLAGILAPMGAVILTRKPE